MMDRGKAGGIHAPIIAILAMVGILLLSESVGLAQRTVQNGNGVDGFRELRWGTSTEQASGIYPDLYFERYAISDGKEEPAKVYLRRSERREIENVTFDSIEYWFKRDHLYRIRAVLNSSIGPRTLVTRAENAFDKINGRLRIKYGGPSGHRTDYVTEFIVVVKETTWIVDRSAVTIRYEGPGKTDEDVLTLIMKEQPGR